MGRFEENKADVSFTKVAFLSLSDFSSLFIARYLSRESRDGQVPIQEAGSITGCVAVPDFMDAI